MKNLIFLICLLGCSLPIAKIPQPPEKPKIKPTYFIITTTTTTTTNSDIIYFTNNYPETTTTTIITNLEHKIQPKNLSVQCKFFMPHYNRQCQKLTKNLNGYCHLHQPKNIKTRIITKKRSYRKRNKK